MRRFLFACLTIALLAACTSPAAPSSAVVPTPEVVVPHGPFLRDSLTGTWIGGFNPDSGSAISVEMVFESETNGSLSLQPHLASVPITDLQLAEGRLSFEASGGKTQGFEQIAFEGTYEAGSLKGSLIVDDAAAIISFVPIRDWEDVNANNYTGIYQFASGHAFNIIASPEFNVAGLRGFAPGLLLDDHKTGEMHSLYPVADDTFLIGANRSIGFPFVGQLTFTYSALDQVNGVLWQTIEPDTTIPIGVAESATPLAFSVEEVRYQSADGITLAGLLALPATPGPHPALVMLHGSERGQRNNLGQQLMRGFLLSQGFALLSFDKRGVDDSEGIYQEAASETNLTVQAQDALAGVNYLLGRDEIDDSHIGLIGGSQAGWIIPIAASQSNDVAFFIITSGPVVSVGTEDLYSAFANDGEAPSQYTQEEISEQLSLFPASGFDPVPLIESLQQPGLWLWGDQDKNIPVPESVSNLEAMIAQGKTNFSYKVFPNVDHFLARSTTGLIADYPLSAGFPEAYYATMAQWLQEQIK
jgi:pimeloyl-ACP methyl ester carboxylesterase